VPNRLSRKENNTITINAENCEYVGSNLYT
jgi:hypothetical protein